jgi:predicted DNA-binding transcriptional regulator YafY
MKTLRLFALLDHLRAARRPVSAEALAARFAVSPRTIYRDIASLQSIGAPIRGESGIGYQLEQGYFLPPLHFDAEEMEAIMLGMRHLIARKGGGLGDAAERVTGKVAAALGTEASEQFRHLNILVATRQREEDLLAERWGGLVRHAIRKRSVLDLVYFSLDGRESRRFVHPLGLTQFDEVWLLTAWCEIAEDFRNFRLDRIKAAAETGARFRQIPKQRFQDYLARL